MNPLLQITIYAFLQGMFLIPYTISSNHPESCPRFWKLHEETASCLKLSSNEAQNLKDAHIICRTEDATVAKIETEDKFSLYKNIVTQTLNRGKKVRIPLIKLDDGLSWSTGNEEMPEKTTSLPKALQDFSDWSGSGYCDSTRGLSLEAGEIKMSPCWDYSMNVMCETHAKCKEGWFGKLCDKECRCLGHTCDPLALEGQVTCPFGCQVGWMGKDCSEPIKQADVNYFCAESSSHIPKHVHIRIDTYNVNYSSIEPVKDDGTAATFCGTVETNMHPLSSAKTIKIQINDEDDASRRKNDCAGKITSDGKHQWKLRFTERKGMVSRNDKTVVVTCDFSKAKSFVLSRKTDVKKETWFTRNRIQRPPQTPTERTEKIELVTADTATGAAVPEARIGATVVLKIRFGKEIQDDSIVTGVVPFNCKAMSKNRQRPLMLLDDFGCPYKNSPISAFFRNGTNSVVTKPFIMFGLDESLKVNFKCSYNLCFGKDECPVGCASDSSP